MEKRLFIRANNRINGIVNRHLEETVENSWECFEETVRRSHKQYGMWDTELELKVEELYSADVYDPIYELLLKDRGVLERWAKLLGDRYNIDWCELFSDFQLHLFNMLDGIADKAYNPEIRFMNNLFKQLECVTKDKRKYLNRNKRKWDSNCVPTEILEQIPDSNNKYVDSELIIALQALTDINSQDKRVLIGLATGQITKKDIPTLLNWTNKDDRMKLSRYCKKMTKILIENGIILQ